MYKFRVGLYCPLNRGLPVLPSLITTSLLMKWTVQPLWTICLTDMRGSFISWNLWHGRAAFGSEGRSRMSVACDSMVEPLAHPAVIPFGVNCSFVPL